MIWACRLPAALKFMSASAPYGAFPDAEGRLSVVSKIGRFARSTDRGGIYLPSLPPADSGFRSFSPDSSTPDTLQAGRIRFRR